MLVDFCYDGAMVIFPLKTYLSSCSPFFSFVLFGNCPFLDLDVQVPGVGVYDSGNLPVCFVPFGRLSLSNDCVLVFSPLIPPCGF